MLFIEAFADELTKEGRVRTGLLQRIGESLPGAGMLAAVGGGAAAIGHTIGKRKGERQGIEEGTAFQGDAAERAYQAGIQRGARAMQEAIVAAGEGNRT
jgi:hypothetical protein